jgi:hypothetical protein
MAHPALSPLGEPMCAWAQENRKFAIQMRPEILRRLATESWIAFKRVPRRGLEIGGILLGRIETRDDRITFWIEGFEQVESEHRTGPSYVLSESDFDHLQGALKKNGASSLGIYRSQTRSQELALQEADCKLFGRCFDTRDALFLLLAPATGMAAFFIQDAGSLKCVHEFALASRLSPTAPGFSSAEVVPVPNQVRPATEIQPEIKIVPVISGPQLDIPSPIAESSAPSQPAVIARRLPSYERWKIKFAAAIQAGTIIRKGRWVLVGIAASAILFASANLLSKAPRAIAPPSVRPPQYLHLTVERSGLSLRLAWDRNSAALQGATRAVLHIDDGSEQSDRELSSSQIGAGSLVYEPKSSDVTFRMDIFSVEPNASGLVQVMNLSAPSPVPPAASGGSGARSAPVQTTGTLLPIRSSLHLSAPSVLPREQQSLPASQKPRASASLAEADYPTPARIEPVSTEPVEKEKTPPPALKVPDRTEAKPFDRSSLVSTVTLEKSRPTSPIAEAPANPTHREPSVSIVTEPVPGSRLGQLAGKLPLVRRFRKPERTAVPVPVYRAQPTLKIPDKQTLIHPVAVDVKVFVAESGTVKNAEVVEYGDPPNWSLANAALVAARKWTFEPARVEEMPVSSEVLLHFRFTP